MKDIRETWVKCSSHAQPNIKSTTVRSVSEFKVKDTSHGILFTLCPLNPLQDFYERCLVWLVRCFSHQGSVQKPHSQHACSVCTILDNTCFRQMFCLLCIYRTAWRIFMKLCLNVYFIENLRQKLHFRSTTLKSTSKIWIT